MSGTLHKLTAGNGYTYLTRQTAASDSTELGRGSLADYYSEKGEAPGRWWGSGLRALGSVRADDVVSETQMKALFGEGRHPDAEAIEAAALGAGRDARAALKASKIGRVFVQGETSAPEFLQEVARRFTAWNVAEGRRGNASVPDEVRAEIRSQVGREMFLREQGRPVSGEEELSAFVARNTRPKSQVCAGYDMTFTPVKSVSTLWAIAPREVSEAIERAHHAAVAETMEWVEGHASFTRRGAGGVRVIATRGLMATMFQHRDSRAGDPNLHTHVAVSNKVQAEDDGAWLALHGSVIYKAFVGASEHYNTSLERFLARDLGLKFEERRKDRDGALVTREVSGVDERLADAWSSRRRDIEQRKASLVADFRSAHGRLPTPKEGIALAQQANLETRQAKHEHRSLGEQRATWRNEAAGVLGSEMDVDAMILSVMDSREVRTRQLLADDLPGLADTLLDRLEERRSRFQPVHVIAEAQRMIRELELAPDTVDAAVARLVDEAVGSSRALRLGRVDPVQEPSLLRRADGSSVYSQPLSETFTTPRIWAAEQRIVHAATDRSAMKVDAADVALALQEAADSGKKLNASQELLVRDLATSGQRVHLSLAPAGSGKTTAMAVLARAWEAAGGAVIGLSPTAVAAAELGESISAKADTLASLTYSLDQGEPPVWARDIDEKTLVIIDEAGMASTIELDKAIGYIASKGGSVRLIGDDQQLASVAAGGVLVDIRNQVGAASLTELMRFKDSAEAAATLALREGDVTALGFYFDRERVHATEESDLISSVFNAWSSDRLAGHETMMLASTRVAVNELNDLARSQRLAECEGWEWDSVVLSSGLRASAGDLVVTRKNDRSLRLSANDFVRNGDRWRVQSVGGDGSMDVVHQRSGKCLHLPKDYVRRHVDLGYAVTIHGAQGATVDTCHVAVSGTESRQQLYVAMSRARLQSHVYVAPAGSSETPEIAPTVLSPQAAFDVLSEVVGRDGAEYSATTFARVENAADTLLPREARVFGDALNVAALSQVGAGRREAIATAAELLLPGLTDQPSWDALLGSLSLIEISGGDAVVALSAAIGERELGSAKDQAAVLDWRLEGSSGKTDVPGPLPWLKGVPVPLAEHPLWGPYLTSRCDGVAGFSREIHAEFVAMREEDLPQWALPLADQRELLGEVAVWRSWAQVDPQDPSLLGPSVPMERARRYQQALNDRVTQVLGAVVEPAGDWLSGLGQENAHVVQDPFWRVVAHRLDLAEKAGHSVPDLLAKAMESGPLPVEQPAGALWFRLVPELAPVAQHGVVGQARLRPAWTDALLSTLPPDAAAQVMRSSAWPTLVAAVDRAAKDFQQDAEELALRLGKSVLQDGELEKGVGLGDVPYVLAWRVERLVSAPASDVLAERDVEDEDAAEFERAAIERLVAAEDAQILQDHGPRTSGIAAVEAPPEHDDLPPDPEDMAAQREPSQVWIEQEPAAVAHHTSRERIVELHDSAADFYSAQYPRSSAAQYVSARFGEDLTDREWITIGYAPGGWTSLVDHLRATTDVTDLELVEAGLAQRTKDGQRLVDVFRDRVVIGVRDLDGALVGFTGRAAPGADAPKYINTKETAAFRKGELLLGLAENADKLAQGAIPTRVEGAFDAIAVTMAGEGRVVGVAPMGTALTDRQADLLADAGPNGVVWVTTDTDKAGIKASHADFWSLAAAGADTYIPLLVDFKNPASAVKDPAELYQRDGGVSLRHSLDVEDPGSTPVQPLLAGALINQILNSDRRIDDREAPIIVNAARNAASIIAMTPPAHWPSLSEQVAAGLGNDQWARTLVASEVSAATARLYPPAAPKPDRLKQARERAAGARERILAQRRRNPTAKDRQASERSPRLGQQRDGRQENKGPRRGL